MHDSRVILVRALIVLTAVLLLAKAHAVTEGKSSIRAARDPASSTTTQNKGASKRLLLGIAPSANLSSSLKKASTWLLLKSRSKSIRISSKRVMDEAQAQLQLRSKLEAGPNKDLLSPEFYAWVADIDRIQKLYPNNKLSLIGLLSKTYTHSELAKVVELALDALPTSRKHRKMVTRLAGELMETWKALGYSEYRVFRLLGLSVVGTNIFERPELSMWFDFVVFKRTGVVDGTITKRTKNKMAAVLTKYYSTSRLYAMFDKAYLGSDRLRDRSVKLGVAVVSYDDLKNISGH
uniref:RxLR effector candidate protein n=1 Tax=Peronospora matthiolae TaxID=2874970 RepID=A0AAV1T801_9STRA